MVKSLNKSKKCLNLSVIATVVTAFYSLTGCTTNGYSEVNTASQPEAIKTTQAVSVPQQATVQAPQPQTLNTGVDLKLASMPILVPMDLTGSPEDIWSSIRKGFAVPEVDTDAVKSNERFYKNNKRLLRSMLQNSEPYIYYIAQECEKRGLPSELALVPFIESQFNPHARSHASAEGLWQFIPSTGQHFDLKQNNFIDERRDLVASTRAALDYLTYLYDMYGDWQLALISYNWGEGSVAKAIQKAKDAGLEPTMVNLDLPAQTANYVPKIQALKNIIESPQRFGVKLPKVANSPYFVEIKRKKDLDLREIAKLSGLKLEELHKLNPGLNQPVLYASQSNVLLVPVDHADDVKKSLEKYKAPSKDVRTYTVAKGDTLSRIAKKMDVSTKEILSLNKLTKKSLIKPGMTLTLPPVQTKNAWKS